MGTKEAGEVRCWRAAAFLTGKGVRGRSEISPDLKLGWQIQNTKKIHRAEYRKKYEKIHGGGAVFASLDLKVPPVVRATPKRALLGVLAVKYEIKGAYVPYLYAYICARALFPKTRLASGTCG